jgi:hypothetical protein
MLNQKGLSLIEIVVSSTMAAVLGITIFTFVSFSDNATQETRSLQELAQVSAIISEVFQRSVHNGRLVTAGNDTSAPVTDTAVDMITIFQSGDTVIQFKKSGGSLIKTEKSGNTILSQDSINPFEAKFVPERTILTVHHDGITADLSYALCITSLNGKKDTTTTAHRRGRCKNWKNKVDNTDPSGLGTLSDVVVTGPEFIPWLIGGGGGTVNYGTGSGGVH